MEQIEKLMEQIEQLKSDVVNKDRLIDEFKSQVSAAEDNVQVRGCHRRDSYTFGRSCEGLSGSECESVSRYSF